MIYYKLTSPLQKTAFQMHSIFKFPTPRTCVPMEIWECPSEIRGRREIKYLPWTKQAWQWAAAFAITNCRWKSRRLVQLEKETLAWDTYCQNGRTTTIIKPQLWINSPTALWVPWERQRLGEKIWSEAPNVDLWSNGHASAAELVPHVFGFPILWSIPAMPRGDPDAWATQVLHIICPGLRPREDPLASPYGIDTTLEQQLPVISLTA